MNLLQAVDALMKRDAVRAVQAREVYLKRGGSLRVHLSASGAISVTRIQESGVAMRMWLAGGGEKFETAATPGRCAEIEVLDHGLEERAFAVIQDFAEVVSSPGHGGVVLEDLWLESGRSVEALGNSEGFRGAQSLERWSCVVSMRTAGTGADRLGWFEAEGDGLLPADPAGIAEEAAARVAASRNGSWLEDAPARVVVDGPLARRVLRAIGSLFVATGESVTLAASGARVAGPGVSVRVAGEPGRFDGEGTARQPVALVENGLARGVLTDGRLARRFGLAPTGSAIRASYRDYPAAAPPRDLEVQVEGYPNEAGADPPADPFSQVRGRAIYLTEGRVMLGEATGSGLIEGRGVLLQDGRVSGPVAQCLLPGGPREWLRHLAGAWDRGKTLLIDASARPAGGRAT